MNAGAAELERELARVGGVPECEVCAGAGLDAAAALELKDGGGVGGAGGEGFGGREAAGADGERHGEGE